MNKTITLLLLTWSVFVMASHARYACVTITPTNTTAHGLKFDVTVKETDRRDTLAFTVAVSTDAGIPADPKYARASLIVKDSTGFLAECRVFPITATNSTNYLVSLDRRSLLQSYLLVSTCHSGYVKDAQGKLSKTKLAVGTLYTVKLNEFIKKPEPDLSGL